jgi:2-polyprenyl-3-methyl-5-hydroxy-6-metoxy-1,4-benzoquinol methylase
MNRPEEYTHGHHESVLRSHSWRTVANSAAYLIPELATGKAVLDVGCGPGTITVDLAERVAPGEVVGIDASTAVIGRAAAHAAESGVANVRFDTGDAYALDFADNTFEIVHAHQTLQHVGDPVAVIREMSRVTKPGGVVAARDADYGAMFWYPTLPGLSKWMEVYQAVHRSNGHEPDAGRHMRQWAAAAGVGEVAATASMWCFTEDTERAWWATTWADRVRESGFRAQAIERGFATDADIEAISAAFLEWNDADGALFAIPNVEIIIRVPTR